MFTRMKLEMKTEIKQSRERYKGGIKKFSQKNWDEKTNNKNTLRAVKKHLMKCSIIIKSPPYKNWKYHKDFKVFARDSWRSLNTAIDHLLIMESII